MESMAEVYYGVRPGLISDDLMESVIAHIITNCRTITIQDIPHAFERADIVQDNNWKNITKRHLVDPINQWLNKKERIRLDFEKFENVQNELALAVESEKRFQRISWYLYQRALRSGVWKGSIFCASSIAEELAIHIPQERKNELWADAKRKKKEAEERTKAKKYEDEEQRMHIPENFGMTALRIFSELIVLEAVKLKIQPK